MTTFATGLVKVTETYAPMIERQLSGNGVHLDHYGKQCVINAISAINTVLDSKGLNWNDEQLDRNNVTQILMNVAALKLNAAASPREVYFQLRNTSIKIKENGKDVTVWRKQIEMGIEGDGNDAILNNFGRNVKQVRPYWLVREGDGWEYPSFNGLEMSPPKWSPKGQGEVIRIVYPIIFKDDSIQYFIGERDDVMKNLIAHINNNIMNETFGVMPAGKTRYDANADQKKQIAEKKAEVLKKAKESGLATLDDPELQQYISPAWSEYHSREQMLIRKMRNNIVKKIPKDFGSAFVEILHNNVADETYASVQREIAENANSEPIDIKAEPVKEARQETQQEPQQQEVDSEQTESQESAQGVQPDALDQAILDFEQREAVGVGASPGF